LNGVQKKLRMQLKLQLRLLQEAGDLQHVEELVRVLLLRLLPPLPVAHRLARDAHRLVRDAHRLVRDAHRLVRVFQFQQQRIHCLSSFHDLQAVGVQEIRLLLKKMRMKRRMKRRMKMKRKLHQVHQVHQARGPEQDRQ
jgi:hypothetical protein